MQFDRLLRLASDDRLVGHVRAGSERAFEVIYSRHHRGVLSFCRHMLGSVEEAEDALQHTFLAAYRDLVGSSKPIHLRPWLYTIARNRCLTVLRARREQALGSLAEPATEHLAAEVERRQDLRAVLADVAELRPDQRAALLLTELGDLSHEEIGEVLGCRRDKVKALVFQARSSLIASRTARETSCAEIREQLANLSGGSLRRSTLRRHLRDCQGCREFGDQVTRQRREIALILPVAPTLGLKAAVFGAAGVAAGGSSASVVATAAVVLTVAGGGTAAAVVETTHEPAPKPPKRAAPVTTSVPVQPGVQAASRRQAAAVTPAPVKARKPRPVTSRGQGPPASPPAGARRNGPKAPKAEKVKAPKAEKVEKVKAPKPKPIKIKAPKPVKVKAPKPAKVKAPKPAKIVVAPPAEAVGQGPSGDHEPPADSNAGGNGRGRGPR